MQLLDDELANFSLSNDRWKICRGLQDIGEGRIFRGGSRMAGKIKKTEIQ